MPTRLVEFFHLQLDVPFHAFEFFPARTHENAQFLGAPQLLMLPHRPHEVAQLLHPQRQESPHQRGRGEVQLGRERSTLAVRALRTLLEGK
jgi:hypothetical protein